MARIRTIKPEFWTDEALTECSLSARLLFIGMLNFADDNGNLACSSKRIKMQIFPADNIDVDPLLAELVAEGLIVVYEAGGKQYFNIQGFKRHQVVNRPSKSQIPDVEPDRIITNHSWSTHGALTEHSQREKEKEKEKEVEKDKNILFTSDDLDLSTSKKSETIEQPRCPSLDPPPDPSPGPRQTRNAERSAIAKRVLEFLNAKTGRNFRPTKSNLTPIVARLAEGYSEDEIRAVTARKCRVWLTSDTMAGYLRPKTLYCATNFNNYAGELLRDEDIAEDPSPSIKLIAGGAA